MKATFITKFGTTPHYKGVLAHEVGNIFPVFYQLQEQQQCVALLNNENTIKLVGNYLHRTLECRRFLLKMHKNNE